MSQNPKANAPAEQPRLISFYLPQYHPIPENDTWWGRGFTEWTNVGRAKPFFPGHHQPRVPADLGYYDLRLPETRAAQAALAREHGIHGFCYYHYWFNGRRLLERPFNEVLASGSPDFPFCLCWANENWTRAWDGLEREVLIQQHYNAQDDLEHIRWLATAFRDPRYIRVHGKPLFLVYRVASLPDPMQTVSIWREEAQRLGIGELFLCSVESRVGGGKSVPPAQLGFDAAVEFQPDGLFFPKPLKSLNDYGGIFDYGSVVEKMLQKPAADYLRFPCVTPGWDNSARRKENPTIITGSTPELYEQWLDTVVKRQSATKPGENLIFVNAWNEWGEGAYLEPDQLSGRAYLEATKRVLARQAANAPVINLTSPEISTPMPVTKAAVPATSETNAPLLSVCIPVYNGNKYLEAAIKSVLEQGFTDYELIIVDDCSAQDPAPIISRFTDKRLQFHRNAVRQGLVGNWNRCVELARGRYVCVFHQDDVMLPENLRRKVQALEQNPAAGLAYSDARVVEDDLSTRHPGWFTPTVPNEDKIFAGREFFEKLVSGDNIICCPSAVFRREVFEALGRFDPQLPYTADWEMWLRLSLRCDVAYIKEPLLLYRVHDANETHRFKGVKELEQSYRAKMTALQRAAKELPDAPAVSRRVAHETAEKVVTTLRNRTQIRSAKDLRAWLSFAAEAHKASLPEASFDDASNWLLTALENCGAAFTAGDREEGWSDAEEQQLAQAKQFEVEGRADQALPILERLATTKPVSVRVWFQLGRAQMALSQFTAAEKSWSLVIAQKSSEWLKTFHAYAMRGSVYEKQGRKVEAMRDFARAVQLALYEGCQDLAAELDQWMGFLLQGKSLQQKITLTKEQLRNYALVSSTLQIIGRDLRREGPVSSLEYERANAILESLVTGRASATSLSAQFAGIEAVTITLAKVYFDRAVERADQPMQKCIVSVGRSLLEIAKTDDVPVVVREIFEQSSDGQASGEVAVSIVIPTFNRLDMTRRCLQSLSQHPGQVRAEIIIVDNASTDGTVEFLKAEAEAGRLRAILNPENRGFSKACNQGARAALGRHVLFLNNDTEVQPGWLEPLLETIESQERVVAVGSKLLFPDRTIQHAGVAVLEDRQLPDPLVARHVHYRKPESAPEANVSCTYQALTAACLLVRRTALEKVGGFDEEYWNGYEDVDLCFKLRQEGGLLVYQPRSMVIHHESQSGPERFRQVAHNTQRLHKRWIGKVTPDFLVAQNGVITATTAANILAFNAQPAGAAKAPLVSIIILAFNQLAHTRLCLDSIRAHTTLPHELILVDNGSTDGTSEYFHSLAAQQGNIAIITNRRNLGFAAGNNQGLAIARGECVVLLNNDTVVTEGWLEKMLAALQRHPDVGIVGPMSNYVAGAQLVKDAAYKNLEGLPRFAAEWSKTHAGQTTEINRVVGFCLLARKSVVSRIGGLDEQFGSGNFEDDDYCLRALFAGYRILIAQDAFIHHTGSQTFAGAKIDYRESMLRNWKLFKAKWSMPADAPIENGYRVPTTLPATVALKVALPKPGNQIPAATATTQKPARPAQPLALPPCALMGNLSEARELLKKKKLEAAWTATAAAITSRPFHPEAALLLAEIAQAAGDSVSARHCAQYARQLAPEWKPAKQFLKGSLRGNSKPAWLVLPPVIVNQGKHAPKVSVCLIVKNEEKFLGQCLASIRDVASQIIVVDTGSTDRTVEIAKQANAEVHSFTWTDDFSAARNEALKHATGDWILSLDADEELVAEHRQTILQEIQAAAVLAYRLPIVDKGREKHGSSYVPRLFRNAPGLFFLGRVHEQIFSSLEVRRQEWGLENRLGKAALLHHGYTDEVMADRNKIERNLRLLERAIEELPDEPNLLMSLGLELVRSGRVATGLDRYHEAVQALSALPAAQVVPELRETLLTQYSTHLLAAKRFAEITQLWDTPFAKATSVTASQHFVLGLANMELRQPAAAAEQLRQCLIKRSRPALSPINPEILGAGPNHLLALALAAQNHNNDATAAFRAALVDDPKSRVARFDFARFQFERGDAVESLKLLHELVAENPQDASAWQLGGQIVLSRVELLEFGRDWTTEAVKHFPQHPVIVTQRAEVLLLSQDTGAALRVWASEAIPPSARQLAAVIICEAAAGKWQRQPASGEEYRVSQELVKWCRALIAFRANGLISQLSENLDPLRAIVPTFAGFWETATREAKSAAVV